MNPLFDWRQGMSNVHTLVPLRLYHAAGDDFYSLRRLCSARSGFLEEQKTLSAETGGWSVCMGGLCDL
jgi:hypothetical protein